MQFPTVTSVYAAILALLLAALSVWVIVGRNQFKVNLGEGTEQLQIRVRAHGNFVEYVPFILLLVAMLEAAHTSRLIIHCLLLPLLVARCLHPVGLTAPPGTLRQYSLRGGSMVVTLIVMSAAALLLLLRPV